MRVRPAQFMRLFPEFRADSWSRWREILERIGPGTREVFVCAGRGGGKSRIAALLATWAAARQYQGRAPGEEITVGCFGPSMSQAKLTFNYIRGLIDARPELRALAVHETAGRLELKGNVVVEVLPANLAAPRGRSYAMCVVEEAAFLPTGDSANPDTELLRAIRPALARVPGSLLAVVSSPYSRRGILWQAAKRHEEQNGDDGDGRMLYIQAPTLELNPTFDADAIAAAYEDDPVGAAAEFGALFRRDIESFVSREAVEACVVSGRHELPPVHGVEYTAFVDPSGGARDSFTLAIGHSEERDGRRVAVVDCLRERKAPFSPEDVTTEFSKVLARYDIRSIEGDRYAGQWPSEAFGRHGIEYEPAGKTKSDLYRDALALLNGQRVELPDHDRLVTQLVGLERRTARGGRDSIDHGPGGRDDLANVVAGLAVGLALEEPEGSGVTWGSRIGGIWGSGPSHARRRNDDVTEVIVSLGRGEPGRIVKRRSHDELLEQLDRQRQNRRREP